MSRILRGRRLWFFLFLIIVSVFLVSFRQYCLLLLFIAGCYLNHKTVQRINLPKKRLTARRKVEMIETLIIGDRCPDDILKSYCQLNNSLKIIAPLRSLASSELILDHVESVLSNTGTVVIVSPKRKREEKISLFDLPYIGIVASKELGVEPKSFLNRIPLLRHPVRCLLWLFPSRRNFLTSECPDLHIVNLCKRKGFHLIYLH